MIYEPFVLWSSQISNMSDYKKIRAINETNSISKKKNLYPNSDLPNLS